jgi:Branched-chain amino acid aminotransferase/4-amino-4-deoxychorismate lyase
MDLAHSLLNHNKVDGAELYALNTFIVQGEKKSDLIFNLKPTPQAPKELHLIICETTRRNEHSPLSRIKSLNYGDNLLALKEAEQKGAGDAVLLNTAGDAACTTFGNLYADIGGQLYTPPLKDGAMDGVFRSKAVEKYGVQERTLSRNDLEKHAEGIYIANSVRGFYPAFTINKKTLPKTNQCIKLF